MASGPEGVLAPVIYNARSVPTMRFSFTLVIRYLHSQASVTVLLKCYLLLKSVTAPIWCTGEHAANLSVNGDANLSANDSHSD